jgi:GH43 family beta-xylosidase
LNKIFIILTSLFFCFSAKAQKIDSLFLHLYTDSLKRGTFNYINLDGKTVDGNWFPLTAKELNFSATYGIFEGNSLYIDSTFKGEKITITASLKANPSIRKVFTLYIKKLENPANLKTEEEILNSPGKRDKKNNNKS